jgi:hypothetical protein
MEASDWWDRLDAACRPHGAADRSVLSEREVGPDLIVTVGIGPQHIPAMPFVKDQDMIEALAPDGAHATCAATIMPG